ncbi:hypothetical protein EKD04_020870 [Chloroflexales bacterium ZM16-3]|nr:hypothetical protein [Chloroflexales bacterium ZM16-3]
MPPLRDRIERALRQGFRLLNRLMVLLWRLGLGPSLSLAPRSPAAT